MRLKIFSCHHLVTGETLSTGIYQTLVSGHRGAPDSGIWSDLDGRNIAFRQKFCELRHQYYVWQNLLSEYDYVGFEHYRRPFFLDPLDYDDVEREFGLVAGLRRRASADPARYEIKINRAELEQYNRLRRSLDDAQQQRLRRYVESYDVLFTFPMMIDVNRSFQVNHSNAEHAWLSFAKATKDRFLLNIPATDKGFAAGWSAYLNMYILSSDLFAEYMEFLFPALIELDDALPDAPPRLWGHLTERAFGPFIRNKLLQRPTLRMGCIPHLFQDRTD
jgi:hypothetical protein